MMNSVQADTFIQGTEIRSLYGSDKHFKQLLMRYIALSFYLLIFFSCASQKKEIIAKSIIKLEEKNTNIRNLMKIDGYYSRVSLPDSNCMMFFEDGTCVYFSFKRDLKEKQINKNMAKAVVSQTQNMQSQWGTYWGVYTIKNDTIFAYSYDKGSFWKSWSIDESRYKIINNQTILRIYYGDVLNPSNSYYKIHSPWIEDSPLHFTPADTLPSSDNWLKENKWIWRNESDWKNYMQHVEQTKKQYKKK